MDVEISVELEKEINYYKSIIVLNMGGTINMSGSSEKKPSNSVVLLIDEMMSNLKSKYNISVYGENIFSRPPDSSNIGELEWDLMYDHVKRIHDRKTKTQSELLKKGLKVEKGGIVITHGTDTMDISALILSFQLCLCKLDLPIIFTGSYSTLDEPGSDAKSNLKKSIILAKERFSRKSNFNSGVYVVIGQDIHLASRISKVYTNPNSDSNYFFSFPVPIGRITGDEPNIKINSKFLFDISGGVGNKKIEGYNYQWNWGIVEHIVIDKFSNPMILESLIMRYNYYKSKKDCRNKRLGLIVQGNFINNKSYDKLVELICNLDENKIPVVFGSKKIFNRIKADNPNLKLIGIIPISLSHHKARCKLSWLLRLNITVEVVLELMSENIIGDVLEIDKLPEWINYESFPPQIESREIISVYPNIDNKVFKDSYERLIHSKSKIKELYVYGFGDGHMPLINSPINIIVTDYINKKILSTDIVNLPENIHEMINQISFHVKQNKDEFLSYLRSTYKFRRTPFLYKFMQNQLIEAEKEKKCAKSIEIIKDDFKDFIQKYIDVIQKDTENILQAIINEKTICLTKDEIGVTNNVINDILNSDFNKLLLHLISDFPLLISFRIIKSALMDKVPILQFIGEMTCHNIAVRIRSQAVRSVTDVSKYEIGNMLQCVGVDSDTTKGFIVDYLY